MNVVISNHSIDRIRERMGCNKKSCLRIAELAYKKGITRNDVTGNLSTYMGYTKTKSQKDTEIKLYGDKCFVFIKDENAIVLLTVMQIPTKLMKAKNKSGRTVDIVAECVL